MLVVVARGLRRVIRNIGHHSGGVAGLPQVQSSTTENGGGEEKKKEGAAAPATH